MTRPRRSGFTLVEILIALIVLMVGLVGILALFPVGLHASQAAIEESVAAVLADSVRSSIVRSVDMAGPSPPSVPYHHDGVPTGFAFDLPVVPGMANARWIPGKPGAGAAAPPYVLSVGRDNGRPTDLPALAVADAEDGAMVAAGEPNPYDQYAFKFHVDKAGGTLPNLYESMIYVFRRYDGAKGSATDAGEENVPVAVYAMSFTTR